MPKRRNKKKANPPPKPPANGMLTLEQALLAEKELKQKNRSKYGNVRNEFDGHKFDSLKEARRYSDLKLMQQQGLIQNLELQPRYKLLVNGGLVTTYVADFRYDLRRDDGSMTHIVEDVKSKPSNLTKEYKLKRKLMEHCLNILIYEFY